MGLRLRLMIADFVIVMGIILLIISNFLLLQGSAVRDTRYNALKAGRVLTSRFVDYYEKSKREKLNEDLEHKGYRLVLIDGEGRIYYSNDKGFKAGEKADIALLSPDYDEKSGYVKLVYPVEGDTLGQAVYYIPQSEVMVRLRNSSASGIYFLIIGSSLAILVSFLYRGYILNRRIYRSISDIYGSILAVQKEDFTKEISYGGDDEISRLCEEYESMRLKLWELNEASRINQEKYQELIAGISHDLRTPMSSIKAYSEALKDNVAEDEETRRFYLDVISNKAEQVIKLTKDLLENSLDALGGLKIKTSEVYSESFIRNSIQPFYLEAKKAGITVEILNILDILIIIDVTRMEQVISNIMNNAIKYTPGGGRITIDADRFDDYYMIEIHNSGNGIDSEELPFIFDRFYRSKQHEGRKEGSGLGLYIVKMLMEKQGGSIEVESSPKDGTTFKLYIPMS